MTQLRPPTPKGLAGKALLASLALAALLCAPAWAGGRLTGAAATMLRHTGRAGGQLLASAGFLLHNTAGEVGGGALSGGGVRLQPGFIPLSAQPGSITAMTALSKSTGTLELAWTAPGVDGFQGQVVSGFYRLDYSSDPLHAFSPAVYRTEFSTTVSPGSAQAVTLTGLEPNTTYYARIYLADARKFFAEDSKRSEESTLANFPINPVLASVGDTSVRISWTIPAGGAAGYGLDSSSTSFGALLPGGVVVSSLTHNSLELSLTIVGLSPNTTYFFKVASLNWQGDRSYSVLLATRTLPSGAPLPIENLVASVDARARTVQLTWQNPVIADHRGVLVILSTSPSSSVLDGISYGPSQTLSDGAVVKSTVVAVSFADGGLTLHTTYFYHLRAFSGGPAYSVQVSTAVFLNLPPMAPAGISSFVSSDRKTFAFNWKPVSSSDDGTLFSSTAALQDAEISRYEVFRATSVLTPNWTRVSTLPASSQFFAESIPDPGQTFVYKVESVDGLGARETSMAVDTERNLYAYAPDQVTRLQVPASLTQELLAAGNKYGSDLIIRAQEQPASAADKVFRAVRFDAVKTPSDETVSDFQFSRSGLQVALRYEVAGGRVVASGPPRAPQGVSAPSAAPSASGPARPQAASEVLASQAESNLGMYWGSGGKFVKLFGKVDPAYQTVSVQSPMAGSYQIRSLLRASGFQFDLSQVSNKVITPNNDGRNDTVVFRFDNPRDSAFSGKIYDLRGAFVSDMAAGPGADALQWDGRAGGSAVEGGVYVYQIRGEEKVFNGTLVVIR